MKELRAKFLGASGSEEKHKELERLIEDGSAEASDALGEIFIHSANKKFSRLAMKALLEKAAGGTLEAQESLCRLVIEYNQSFVRELVLETGYAPREPQTRALFYFLTEQWDKYDTLDFEQKLLTARLSTLKSEIRQRLNAVARQAGRLDFITALTGNRHSKRLEDLNEKDWQTALEILETQQAWEEMWRLAQLAPPIWSLALLLRLKEAAWKASAESEQHDVTQLLEKAGQCAEGPDEFLKESVVCTASWTHPDGLSSVAISPDGKMLAAGGFDATVYLRSLPDGKFLHVLKDHSKWVNCLAFSLDGRVLISGAFGWQHDKPLRVWEVPEGRMLHPAGAPGSETMSIAVHPDGSLLAYAGRRGRDTICLLQLQDQRVPPEIDARSPDVLALTFSPDGQYLFSGNADGIVRVWTVADRKPCFALEGHTESVDCIAVSSDSRLLASGGRDAKIRLWSLAEGTLLKTIHEAGATSWVKSLTFSPDGSMLASGGHDCAIRLWSIPDGKLRQTLTGHEGVVTGLAFSPEGDFLASSSADRSVRLWDVWKFHTRRLLSKRAQHSDLQLIARVLEHHKCSPQEQSWLEFTQTLLRRQQRFDIEVAEHPSTISFGEFDIELGESL